MMPILPHSQRLLDWSSSHSLVKSGGVACVQKVDRDSKHAVEREGVKLGCHHAWLGSLCSRRKRVAIAMDGSTVVQDMMTYCAALPARGDADPERTGWLPPKVFALQRLQIAG